MEIRCVNKKVLLREHKRHTSHRVASTPSAVLSREVPHHWPGVPPRCGQTDTHTHTPVRTVPSPVLGYPPVLTWLGGTPSLARGYPILAYPPSGTGIPPGRTWDQSLGYPLERTVDVL